MSQDRLVRSTPQRCRGTKLLQACRLCVKSTRICSNCTRTRSGDNTTPQQTQVAFARVTVPPGTSLSVLGSKTSNSTLGGDLACLCISYLSARRRVVFLPSQNERTKGISAPQFGDSQRTVRAQR